MTLPQFVKHGNSSQEEQKVATGKDGAVPEVKHVDLLKDRLLETEDAKPTEPTKLEEPSKGWQESQ